jgi:hypothetical protein
MVVSSRSAAGQAAGYHFQIQRALLALLSPGPDDRTVALETLDDVVIGDGSGGPADLEQLKHSIRPGSLTDRSRPWWKALEAWMDLVKRDQLDQVDQLVLVATDRAPDGSSAALLRGDDDSRDPVAAERLLIAVASEMPGPKDTRKTRARFAEMDPRHRARLLAKIVVRDGSPPVDGFRDALSDAIDLALPRVGIEAFLDRLVGWWERRAVDLLIGRRDSVSRGELREVIAELRDQYHDERLPDADPDLDAKIGEALIAAYADAPFVRQLELLVLRERRVQLAIREYHRAFTQRSRWLHDGVLGPDELGAWERRLVDEWEHAWERMLDDLADAADEPERTRAGRKVLEAMELSELNQLRDGRDRFVHLGTLHGLADTREIGWHPDFEARLLALLGPVSEGARSSDAHDAATRNGTP